MGRMFVQFVALCYYEHFSEQLREMKRTLGLEISNHAQGTAESLKRSKKLLAWLQNTPVYLTLQWFDAVEEVKVSTKLLSKRWTTEITERDKMFLDKLGLLGV